MPVKRCSPQSTPLLCFSCGWRVSGPHNFFTLSIVDRVKDRAVKIRLDTVARISNPSLFSHPPDIQTAMAIELDMRGPLAFTAAIFVVPCFGFYYDYDIWIILGSTLAIVITNVNVYPELYFDCFGFSIFCWRKPPSTERTSRFPSRAHLPTTPADIESTTAAGECVLVTWTEIQAFRALCSQQNLTDHTRRELQAAWQYEPCLIHIALVLNPSDEQSVQDLLGKAESVQIRGYAKAVRAHPLLSIRTLGYCQVRSQRLYAGASVTWRT